MDPIGGKHQVGIGSRPKHRHFVQVGDGQDLLSVLETAIGRHLTAPGTRQTHPLFSHSQQFLRLR